MEVVKYVLEDPTHLGLIAQTEHYHGRDTNFILIKTYPLQVCLHKDHPLAGSDKLSFGDLRRARLRTQ